MARPYALLRAGLPYLKTLGMRRWTNYPADVAVGGDDTVYVLCRASGAPSIRKLAWEDEDLGAIGSAGTGDGQFRWPATMLMDDDGNLVVSDEELHRITTITTDGEFVGKWGEHGSGEGQLDHPSGIAFDPEGNVYVSDTMNHRVQRFSRDGSFILSFGRHGSGEGELDMPWGIAVDELGDVYVADWRNDRVQKFTAEGDFIFSLGRTGSGDGEFDRPAGVEVDSDGDIYVADSGNDRVQMFNSDRLYLEKIIGDASLSRSGREYLLSNAKPMRLREMTSLEPQKRLRDPKTVRVDDGGRIFIPDYGSYRVQVYQKDAVPLSEADIIPPLRSPTLDVT